MNSGQYGKHTMQRPDSFSFARSRGIIWVCDIANSSQFINDNASDRHFGPSEQGTATMQHCIHPCIQNFTCGLQLGLWEYKPRWVFP
jgi:hypothetical protein